MVLCCIFFFSSSSSQRNITPQLSDSTVELRALRKSKLTSRVLDALIDDRPVTAGAVTATEVPAAASANGAAAVSAPIEVSTGR